MKYRLQAVDHPDFSDLHWERFYAFIQAMHGRGLGNPPPQTREALKTRTVERIGIGDGFREWVLWYDERAVGWQQVHPRGEAAKGQRIAFLAFNIDPQIDIEQAAPVMASQLAKVMAEQGYGKVHSVCPDAHLDAVRRAWGGRILSRMVKYRLDRNRADRKLIEGWLAEFPPRFPELRLEIFAELPDEHIDAWLALFRQFMEDMPNEGGSPMPFSMSREEVCRFKVLRRKNRQYLYTAALFDGNAQLIGHSNMVAFTCPPVELHQAMSGIDRAWRGRGLSKWLKAALFVRTGEDFPESRYIITEMRSVNEPILAVNRAMGYELFSEGYEWAIDLAAIEQAALNR